jgi:glycine/D-amino acid oxidase-like deaminating enzyme
LQNHPHYIIVGQGISGTMLAWYLEQAKQSFVVIDTPLPNSASRVSSGIINPVTGRRIVKTWMIDTLMPFAADAYRTLEKVLSANLVQETSIYTIFPTVQMRQAFLQCLENKEETAAHLRLTDDEVMQEFIHPGFGNGEIHPALVVNIPLLIQRYREKLRQQNQLLETPFLHSELIVGEKSVQYKNITAKAILFCEGVAGAENPFFKNLPFAPNKGEALLIAAHGLPRKKIIKKGLSISPVGEEDLFWAGGTHHWEYTHDQPDETVKTQLLTQLQNILITPFTVVEHIAALRPATLERRPFVGMHPAHAGVGILNGMGSKGASLSPYFARQLADHLTQSAAIWEEADVQRFRSVLLRK